ncbi:hypothetical protein [Cellulomonas denverensis]|uniref:Lipoprotein n=1 Tax=Cellulomonas denverensis TaxID=264297 RepID=A0A7X6KTU2_9CELL|nr:hypothetical protein [Cellulomonas denverensis]NKY21680.1 hypothetical protein [Cellulomonas denverensis]GIG25662.1 hypothetical protein Cde04nite_19060 [Cellulomonas denverensis]
MRLAPALTGLALLIPLAACTGGGDDEAATFCDQSESSLAEIDAIGALGDDAGGFADAVSQISTGFAEADPPAEIADDWATLGGLFSDLSDRLEGVDTDDQEAVAAAVGEFSEQVSSTELGDASDRVSAYVAEHCAE